LIENNVFSINPHNHDTDIRLTRQEEFVNSVYASVDDAIRCELIHLQGEKGVIPTCKLGCYYCCGQHILVNIAEAHCLVQYINREFTKDQIYELRLRTQRWHEWDAVRVGRYPSSNIDQKTAISIDDSLYCPLLVGGVCSAYSMRPIICRTHFVCSNPSLCANRSNTESKKDEPLALKSVVMAVNQASNVLRNSIENEGLDFHQSIMLLPHWLANAMGWDFAISF